MIRLLQKRFIVTAMIAITILIVSMLGAINVVNIIAVKTQVDNHLHMIAGNSLNPFEFPKEFRNAPPFHDGMKPRTDGDRIQASPFFFVNCNWNGEILYVDSEKIPSLTKDDILHYIEEVQKKKEGTGTIGNYRYLVSTMDNKFYNIVFLDTSDEIYSYLRVLILSGIIGFICWCVMLVLVVFLSKKAIRPIAESLEKQKTFITNAGHEIKTPLAIIQTNVEAMELYQGESKWSNHIRQQTIRLGDLMKNMLQLSKMDESNLVIDKEEIHVAKLITDELSSFEELFVRNGLFIIKNMQCEGDTVYGNKEQTVQLLNALLDNSVKYAREGSFVKISLNRQGRHVRFSIQNEIDEIPAKNPEQLFERFYRADKARTQKMGGYGIGLSLAKAICEANKYSLECTYPEKNVIDFTIIF